MSNQITIDSQILPSGGEVLLVEGLPPEANAMAQALYSRDPRTVRVHVRDIRERGADKFMGQYYVQYGHKSIGDCGSVTLFFEGVSMLAAKAIQDWPLYSGQEASTRYLDMANQPLVFPCAVLNEIQHEWMRLYVEMLEYFKTQVAQEVPCEFGGDAKVWQKAVNARAFDCARGFLPAGCATYVSWHTNLRQANDHLQQMLAHPLDEIRQVASMALKLLRQKFTASFGHTYSDARMQYDALVPVYARQQRAVGFSARARIDWDYFGPEERQIMETRPPQTELPRYFNAAGDFVFNFNLDFGSFRDLQRHRPCIMRMPLLTVNCGFHEWYLDQIHDDGKRAEIRARVQAIEKRLINLIEVPSIGDEVDLQYAIAMGYMVECELTCGLPEAVYIAELRSGQSVHSTLRVVAQQIGRAINFSADNFLIPSSLPIYVDTLPDKWSVRRGKQDIVKKE